MPGRRTRFSAAKSRIKEYFPSDLARRRRTEDVAPLGAGTEANFRKGLNQFLVEARTLARFVHPNIGRVDRYFEANGTSLHAEKSSRRASRSRTSSPAGRSRTKRR